VLQLGLRETDSFNSEKTFRVVAELKNRLEELENALELEVQAIASDDRIDEAGSWRNEPSQLVPFQAHDANADVHSALAEHGVTSKEIPPRFQSPLYFGRKYHDATLREQR
jgi:hypothetical protein